ncbi:MFS transporter [Pseudovibrio exalbescens]|uniref:MFS transporter n=1 Tax=Pseudovibrio exalbescens TaxID=197461 RepID=UPI0023671350|nr:MFS transporter [Pseudovibrio exalbescens]MDD7911972.1 MFS transporter [Pseudovibrio exalbescens]
MKPLSDENRSLWIICSMGTLSGLVLLDETVLGVAIPSIQTALGLSHGTTHWIVNAYFLTLTCLAALGGKCVDLFGLRPVLIAGGTVFALASLLAGLAESGPMLIAMRALQGGGAALLFALSQAGANMAFPPEKRGLGIGIYAAIATTSLAIGPLIGGVITHYVSWNWVFWLNIPIVALAGAIAYSVWKEPDHPPEKTGLDWVGGLLMLIGLCGLVFALMEGSSLGWLNIIVLASAAAGLLGLFLFDRFELRQRNPLIDVHLFRVPAFTSACFVFMCCQYVMIVMAVFLPIFLQSEMGYTAAQAGLAVVLAVVPIPLISAQVGRLADKIGSRPIVITGTVLGALATVCLAVLMPLKSYWLFAGALVPWGIAMVCIAGPSRRIAVNSAPANEQGQLSGTVVTIRLLGSTIGVAASSAMLTAGFSIPFVFGVCAALLVAAFATAMFLLSEAPAQPREPGAA